MDVVETSRVFGPVDIAVFSGMLLLSLGIGFYYAFKDRNNKTVENYYFAERSMSPIPVGLSIAVSFISSLTVLGTPSHAYVHGSVIIWIGFSAVIQVVIACLYYIPLFQRLQLSSVYEYLEIRYHRAVRLTASTMIILNMVFYMGTTIYITGLGLNVATPLGIEISIILTAGICTIYTSMGGMKAVVWNDAFQSGIMFAGICAVMIKTTSLVGGFEKVWEALERGNRNNFWTFDMNPTLDHTAWTILVGNGIGWVSIMCSNQAVTQRYQSCSSVRTGRQAAIIASVPMLLLIAFAGLSGCGMYAYYEGCDPLKSGKISKIDQTVVYLVLDIFRDVPGVPGLFVSAAYSGMLSTVSSGINSVGALLLEDFILPVWPDMKESFRLTLSKFMCLILGILVTVMAFVSGHLGKTVVQIVISSFGTFGGPILGLFLCGLHFPWTNALGGFLGLVCGLTVGLWFAIGGILNPHRMDNHSIPFSVESCPDKLNSTNVTWTTMKTISSSLTTEHAQRSLLDDSVYSLSYMYIAPCGMLTVIFVSLAVSFLSGKNDPETMNPELFIPLVDNKYLPQSVRTFFRFGVRPYENEKKYDLCEDKEKSSSSISRTDETEELPSKISSADQFSSDSLPLEDSSTTGELEMNSKETCI